MSTCRICFEEESLDDKFVRPCKCKGDVANIHEKCLQKWIDSSNRSECEICHHEYQKKEIISCLPKKYCEGCIRIEGNHTKTVIIIFLCSLFVFNAIDPDQMILFISCSSISMYLSAAIIAYKVNLQMALDSMLLSKIASTVSLQIANIILMIDTEMICSKTCLLSFNSSCDSLCPVFMLFENNTNIVSQNFIYDMINLGIVILIRSIVICPKYNRKIVFKNMEEHQSLIDNEII